MKETIDIIIKAKNRGLLIELNGENLSFKLEKGKTLDPDLASVIKENKPNILNFLLKEQDKKKYQSAKIPGYTAETGIPLSFWQESSWIESQLNGVAINLIPFVFRMEGPLNKEALKYALKNIVKKHEVFRTSIKETNGTPYQDIVSEELWNIEERDERNKEFDLETYLKTLKNKKYDFSTTFSLQAELICISEEFHVLIIIFNHISTDYFSEKILIKEVSELYNSKLHNLTPDLKKNEFRYADYAIWQRENLVEERYQKGLDFFKTELDGIRNFTLHNKNSDRTLSNEAKVINVSFSEAEYAEVTSFLKSNRITLNILNLSALYLMLYRDAFQKDVCIGIPISTRTIQSLKNIVGYFINTVPLRGQIDEKFTFLEFISYIRNKMINVMEHQEVPLASIADKIRHTRQKNRHSLFQVVYNHLDYSESEGISFENIKITRDYTFAYSLSEFDLVFTTQVYHNNMGLLLKYRTDFIEEQEALKLLSNYKNMILELLINPEKNIKVLFNSSEAAENISDRKKYIQHFDFSNHYNYLSDNEISAHLHKIWKNIFRNDNISVTSDFFLIGGNSLLAVKLIALIRKEYLKNYNIQNIYQFSTIEKLTYHIKKSMLKRKYSRSKRK